VRDSLANRQTGLVLDTHIAKITLLLLTLAGTDASAAADRVIQWSITPYIWATDTTYKLKSDGESIGSGEIDFGDLMDTLDASFQVVAEAGFAESRWSAFVDLTYLSTSDDETFDIDGIGTARLDTDSEQVYVDAAIAFWPWRDVSGFNVYGGIRYTDLDDRTTVDLTDPIAVRLGRIRLGRDYTDALIGMRDYFNLGRFGLSENLDLHIRADYGFGDSEGILMAQAAVRWAIGKERRQGLMVGYRYKEAEFKSDSVKEEYKYKGPVVGFNFRF